eukprot:SAG22_NODE_6055_length_909_cov_0.944444_2_plen_112_part_01
MAAAARSGASVAPPTATVRIRNPEPNYPVTLAENDEGELVTGFVAARPPAPTTDDVRPWPFEGLRKRDAAAVAGSTERVSQRRRLSADDAEDAAIDAYLDGQTTNDEDDEND